MARILKGAEVAASLQSEIDRRVGALLDRGVTPCLAILRVGERGDDIAYESSAMKRCEKHGVAVQRFLLPETVRQEELLAVIERINSDDKIHGCLLLRPLPKHLDEERICAALRPSKDVDGITSGSFAGVFMGIGDGFPPCTASACMEILAHYDIPLSGRRAVVVGRSLVVGKPVAMMLLKESATVTICHTKTKDLPALCREAEVLLVAAGRAGVVGKDCFAPGQTVIDVGIHAGFDGKLCGDVRTEEAMDIVEAITPVPGGVGTVTSTVLIRHVIEAAERRAIE